MSKNLKKSLTLEKSKVKVNSSPKIYEWTDEDIINASFGDFPKKYEAIQEINLNSNKYIDTMENKIARVQQRKKENELRLKKIKSLKPNTDKSLYANSNKIPLPSVNSDVNELEISLNDYFSEVVKQFPQYFNEIYNDIPLYYFNSTEYTEILPFSSHFPTIGVCLLQLEDLSSLGIEVIVDASQVGQWISCIINNKIEDSDMYEVILSRNNQKIHVQEHNLYAIYQDIRIYIRRIMNSIETRLDFCSMLKYHDYISNIPMNISIIPTIVSSQIERIKNRLCWKFENLDFSMIIDKELDEVISSFNHVMKSTMLNAFLLSKSGINELQNLQLPQNFFGYKVFPIPKIPLISYDYSKVTGFHKKYSFLGSLPAIIALKGVVAINASFDKLSIINCLYEKTMSLERFQRNISENMATSVRAIKHEWVTQIANTIKSAISEFQPTLLNRGKSTTTSQVVYDLMIGSVSDFMKEDVPIRVLLDRIDYSMSTTLTNLVLNNLKNFTKTIKSLCTCEVIIHDLANIIVKIPPESPYKTKSLPPMFFIAFKLSDNDSILNNEMISNRDEEIERWSHSKEALNGSKCPLHPIPPIYGRVFEYSIPLANFCDAFLKVFDNVVSEFIDVPHVRKNVMTKIYFPQIKNISSASLHMQSVQELREELQSSIETAVKPLQNYLTLFKKYEYFVNSSIDEVISSKNYVSFKEGNNDIELPVTVNLEELCRTIEGHKDAMKVIETILPIAPLNCGLFSLDVQSIRNLLLDKYRNIIKSILSSHQKYCLDITSYIDAEFICIFKRLEQKLDSIEEIIDMEEYINSLSPTLLQLSQCIQEMRLYIDVLDKFKYKSEFSIELYNRSWIICGYPNKVEELCNHVKDSNISLRQKFQDEMRRDQVAFLEQIQQVEIRVMNLSNLYNVNEVDKIAQEVEKVHRDLVVIQNKSKLYNSREGLFGLETSTDYDNVSRISRVLEPFVNLWITYRDWIRCSKSWKSSIFVNLDAEQIEQQTDKFSKAMLKSCKYFQKYPEFEKQLQIANSVNTQLNDFSPKVPIIVMLRNPGMRDRHWEKISELLQVKISNINDYTAKEVLDLHLESKLEAIQKISECAAKEYQIEQALNKMLREWDSMYLNIINYKDTGTGILKGIDDITTILDEQVTMTQTILFSAFKGPFEERIDEWNRKLCMVSDVLEVWITVQRNWLYLQPIFESPDINRQLPTEGKKFAIVDKAWRQTISNAKGEVKVLDFCDNEKLLDKFREAATTLEHVQKGLSDYLETKRSVFARFYFLSNDELLSILSESKDVKLVQPHLKKCFEGIDKVKFLDNLNIDRIISPEGEEVMLSGQVVPAGKNVEVWMLELEAAMRASIRDVMETGISDYTSTPRPQWMQKWPGMVVLNGSQMHWTREMEELFISQGSKGPGIMYERQVSQLADMTVLVRGELSKQARTTVGALTVIDVHARDVIKKLVDEEVSSKDNFGWTSQLRYYWVDSNLTAQMVAATRPYGYEYLGNTFRLVITPLTDKCYLTLMGALQNIYGGAPAGPAGTGKTETTKDLSKALAMQCVVFNCSDGLDYIAMGKFFKGLASCGAWACFDEFNRINIEVLSVIGQQIMSIQMVIRAKETRMVFEGSDIFVSPRFAVFITMNPGYAGRTALPDSLQALFRPVAMMVPDYALIGEIMFFAYGFEHAKELGAKMVTTFKLCSEQLSSQPHYDYGMRAVKTTITCCGNLKRQEPHADEMVLLLRALQDVNIPKFLEIDGPLFEGIISDLFPGKKRPQLNYGALMSTMKVEIQKLGLQQVKFFTSKVIQLYEMIIVRHGLMLVGPTGGGKSSNLRVLQNTLSSLKEQGIQGFAYEKVKIYQLNPKSITMGQMYGEFDPNTMEWQDGIMSTMYREATADTPDRKWIMFDGPVDAIWIESMNTVLDDNKKLCLNSGEIIKMSDETTMMFEVEDLAVASPATVSRVGIIYMEPKGLGLDVLIHSWLNTIPPIFSVDIKMKLNYLFDIYLQPTIGYLRSYLKELVPTVDNNLTQSLMRILDCYMEPYIIVEGRAPPTDVMIADMITCVDALFIFALIWSVGASVNDEGRRHFSEYLRLQLFTNNFQWKFPSEGMVYDYIFAISSKKWQKWSTIVDPFELDSKLLFSEIIVPTTDSIRSTFMLDLLLSCEKHVLFVGATGTGKTVNISQYLAGTSRVDKRSINSNVIPLTITFSANTSANLIQDELDSKMDKRRKGIYGPPAGNKFYVYIDDLNMPKREEYGAQPPIELLRQWFDQSGWYDRKDLSFRKIIDLTFVMAMGPPGGGRQDVTARMLRHFNIIGLVEMSDASKMSIFTTVMRHHLSNSEGGLVNMVSSLVQASIELFNTIVLELLPTPSKSHYTFNLRDLAKIFQGMLMVDIKKLVMKEQLGRLWAHEVLRVFGDRLTCQEDRNWLNNLMKLKVEHHLELKYDEVMPSDGKLIFGDFISKGSDVRSYDEITNHENMKLVVEDYLSDYNMESKQPMPLVMFADALEHIARIARILRQPQGNALLLGVGGSGRQSMTKLAAYIVGYQLAVVEIVKGYTLVNWREDLKKILLSAGIQEKSITFLFSDVQIIDERMIEDINNILNSGDVPNLYLPEDMEAISNACRVDCQRKKIPPTKLNIYSQYINRVRRNIHVVIAMSPLGEAFRTRLRNFPSLVNCCTIDWFTNWPAEALESVGLSIIQGANSSLTDIDKKTVMMFKVIHLSVEQASKTYYEALRRHNYVTPTSYLELINSFKKLMSEKVNEISMNRDRLQIGLNKLSETKAMVSVMQEELKILQPQLIKTQEDVSNMMIQITKDKASAAETKKVVEVEELNANTKAAEAKAIADDAQRDLAEAIPALEEAVKCLNDLKKADIDEVKSMKTPPEGVLLTIKVCCIMFNIPPVKKNDPLTPGKKIDDYWEAGQKKLLYDAKAFLNSLLTFDKDNIPDRIIKSITVFMEDPKFDPPAIRFSSTACAGICMWARAMYKYHFVALGVAPKRLRLKEAEDELAIVMKQLEKAKTELMGVNNRLQDLEKSYNEAVEKMDMLQQKELSCKAQLANAEKLIGGLGGEEIRWLETVTQLSNSLSNVTGDVIISAATISYLGPFTSDYRVNLIQSWCRSLIDLQIPHTLNCNVELTLADPVKLQSWRLCSLPSDSLSTQNAIIMSYGRRWPLLIDPQGQANRYIRAMAKDSNFAPNGIDIIKLSDKNFLRTLENCIQFGRWCLLENIGESLDAALEPILLQLRFKQGGQEMIKLGDNIIPYNDSFRFFMTTKLSNPHYSPEIQVKVSLLNFTITEVGLEEQLLNVVVAEEQPALSQQKANLVMSNALMNKQLYDIESEILYLLSHSQGNILDDTTLIETLATSKQTSEEIKTKMEESYIIEEEIRKQSENYRHVAKRTSILYFVLADLGNVDPMYQYSLQWFTQFFIKSISIASPSNDINTRVKSLNDCFTMNIYRNICRSLFERHKLLFSFILCVKILQGDKMIDNITYRFLLSGMSPSADPNSSSISQVVMPITSWLEDNMWNDICIMSSLPAFQQMQFLDSFIKQINEWQVVFDSSEPHRIEFPNSSTSTSMSPLEKLCVLRCLRRDKIELAMQDFISHFLGEEYIQPPVFDLQACFNDSTPLTPLIFVLSSGSDPNKDLQILANDMNMNGKLHQIALGQGQGKKASDLIQRGIQSGDWILLQNCHLSISWLPTLEQICEGLESESNIHPSFRLWLTSMPTDSFPPLILQNGLKITREPPKGIRANLRNTYVKLDNNKLSQCYEMNHVKEYQKLLFGLSFFHAIVIERKKFGPLGWNIPYEFNDTDFDISAAQLQQYISEYEIIPYKVLQQLTSVVNYGGRVTDDKDMRTSDILISTFLTPMILQDSYSFSQSHVYRSIESNSDDPITSYMEYIDSLPLNDNPEIFGMHENASITSAITNANSMFDIILSLQPRVSTEQGNSREDQIINMAMTMASKLPSLFDLEQISLRYPTNYHESMNTVLVQEIERYNKLLHVMHTSLIALQRALKGLVVLSSELEAMGNAIFDQKVPITWMNAGYPSLKPLSSWYKDLLQRLDFISQWEMNGVPSIFWISGFYFPQGFLTAILQNYSRKYHYPIDTVSFSFVMKSESIEELSIMIPSDGSYIYGLYLEGARWDNTIQSLIDPKPKELFSPICNIHMLPQQYREPPKSGIYRCPVYKVLTRTGTLSTTGHSTNFVTWIEIPSNKMTIYRSSLVSETNAQIQFCDQDYWIKAGVACFCALRY